jgi:hypothetical protein
MASVALERWEADRCAELDELLAVHRRIGGNRPGRRYATQQLNHAYLVAVAAQFQGFCRDLHSEAVGALTAAMPSEMSTILFASLTKNRKLDVGNANKDSIAEDFGRIGMHDFWSLVEAQGGSTHTKARLDRLKQLNMWRNAIAHDNFERYQTKLDELDGQLRPRLVEGAHCRSACARLAVQMDAAVSAFLAGIVGSDPW